MSPQDTDRIVEAVKKANKREIEKLSSVFWFTGALLSVGMSIGAGLSFWQTLLWSLLSWGRVGYFLTSGAVGS